MNGNKITIKKYNFIKEMTEEFEGMTMTEEKENERDFI